MCGILGFISFNQQSLHEYKEIFNSSLKRLESRGPDNTQIETFENILFGHTRLSVIDLSKRANQPMKYLNDRYTLIFNGEIFNYKELKNELLGLGYTFSTNSDTEVILAAYDCWGKLCVNKFNGMWAFAIYDDKKKEVFCSRDRFGKKPFFYYQKDGLFIFSSEIKAILPFLKKRKVNYDVLAPFITRGITDFNEMTFFENIYKLLPSHNIELKFQNSEILINKYYDIKEQKHEKNTYQDIYSLLEDSISLRLRSDVKVGICLSGGLDSSSIAAIASKINNKNLVAIHGKSSLIQNDESQYAKEVARHLGLDLEIIEPTSMDFWDSLNEVIYCQDEPFSSTSIFMQNFVMKKANELGCKVMLDGQGADEVFLGYETYLVNIFKSLRETKDFNKEVFLSELKLFKFTKEMIESESEKNNDFEVNWNIISNKGNINKEFLNKKQFKDLLVNKDIFNMQKRELFSKRLQALLRYEDRNSMSFGIETRLPFLDYRIVENMLNTPLEKKFDKGYLKYFLRKSMEDSKLLPKNLVWRYNKMGFESPQSLWINEYKDEMLEEVMNSKILSKVFSKIDIRRDDFLWKLFSIARWEKVFNVEV